MTIIFLMTAGGNLPTVFTNLSDLMQSVLPRSSQPFSSETLCIDWDLN